MSGGSAQKEAWSEGPPGDQGSTGWFGTNDTITTNETYTACNSITAGPKLTITNAATVALRARNIIVIRSGFSTASGTTLILAVDPDQT